MRVIHNDAGKPFPISKSFDNMAQLIARAAIECRFDEFLEAFAKDFGASAQIGSQCALFRATTNVTKLMPATRNKISRRLSLTAIPFVTKFLEIRRC
jgi:hypothetical protein